MISLRGVSKTVQSGSAPLTILHPLTLDVPDGQCLAIIGPSGSGKSTLLGLIAGLDSPTSGEILIDGTDITRLDEDALARLRGEKIGFVFQFFHLVPRLTAEQNIELPMMLAGVDPAERKTRLKRLLSEYGLETRAQHRPDQLSGGQCQRVAIARAMAMRPSLILADEPTGNLDRHTGQDVMAVLERLHNDGATLVLVTHDPEIGSRSSRRLRMVDGAIVSDERA